jgi:L-fuconolactonase
VKVIDAHHHLWKAELFAAGLPAPYTPLIRDFSPEDLRPLLDAAGVSQTVLVQTHSALANTEDFLGIADRYSWIAGVVGWVDLTDPALGVHLDRFQKHARFKGVRHQWEDERDPAWIVQPAVIRGLKELARRGLRYDLLAKPPNWPYLCRVAAAVPDLPLVIDHIAKPRIPTQFDDWAEVMRAVAAIPRMHCKLSGMVNEADWRRWTPDDLRPFIRTAIELFGPERCMYGSDWPVSTLAATYAQVFDALLHGLDGLPESAKADVLGGTASRFYGLESSS